MNTYTNPRTTLEVPDWPYGRNRVKAIFTIEQGKKGERATRTTENPKTGGWNKPKKTTFARLARIVDGSDGKTYIAELSQYGHITIMQSNLQYQEDCIHPDDNRYASLLNLFQEAA